MVTIVHFCEKHGIVPKDTPNQIYCPMCGNLLHYGSETAFRTLYPEEGRQHEQAVEVGVPQRA